MVALERPTPWETCTSDQSLPARSARNARTCSRVWFPRPRMPLSVVVGRADAAACEAGTGSAAGWLVAALALAGVAGLVRRSALASHSARVAVAMAAPETSSASPSLTLVRIDMLLPFL